MVGFNTGKTYSYSDKFDRWEPKQKTVGMRAYDPRQIFQYAFDNTDRYGVVLYSLRELAEAIDIRRETMEHYFKDFQDMGWIEKFSRASYRILVKPDEIEWTDQVYERLAELRKWHQQAYRKKQEAKGITKENI